MAAQYTEIYDLDTKSHREPKWDVDGRWRYYEGYGRGSCREKAAFLASVKKDHPLWSSDSPAEKIRKVSFNESLDWMSAAESGSEGVDMADRVDRVTWNSSKMLADFVEKTNQVGRENFFNYGGGGMKWAKNKELMENIGEHLERINQRLVDPKFRISLADQTVKDYPRTHFKTLMAKFEEFMKNGPHMPMEWASVREFIPGASETLHCKISPLARTCPEKVAGAYKIDPPTPTGVPPPRRPTASSKSSVSQLCWEMKQESDVKIDDLQKKIDILIAMNGPVVQARIV
jgi:hypothetical protein